MSAENGTPAMGTHRRRLAEVLRAFSTEVVECDAAEEVFRECAEAVEVLVHRLKAEPRRVRTVSSSLEEEIRMEGGRYHYGDLMDFSPLAGLANPLAPPMNVFKKDDASLVGTVKFGSAFEGGPGLTHGGYLAAAFDELLGLVQSLTGEAGMTAKLKVNYRSPCPLHTELRMEGKVHRAEGRRIVARGTMHAGERLVADGEATFIVLEDEAYRNKISALGGKQQAS
jgi:acyl-coenzyme A thioesterase PaaI-like protein